jgi:ComF family protein
VLFSRLLAAMPLPSLCAVCRGWGAQRLCGACTTRFERTVPRCARCADEVAAGVAVCGACLKAPPPQASAIAALGYQHPWDELITRFKFHAALDLAPVLVQQMLRAHARSGAPAPSLLIPMPLAERRLRERGYNQAWELARRLAAALHCAADARLLLRIRETPHQLALAPGQRAQNVRGAFAVEPARRGELQGRDVTLVDDVMTTGASAAEAARVLLQAGAARVDVWVAARTPLGAHS